jgi:Transposase DNA-binding/Transposase DDE domain
MDVWVEGELAGAEFPDQRLKSRLGKLLSDLGQRIGDTMPAACQDWAATKAAYRFFSNSRVDENVILAGHFAATAARFAAASGPMLILHDTTEFSFKRSTPDAIGRLSFVKGRHVLHTVCGLLLHSSLVLTFEGVPLGLAAVKFWTRREFKGTNECKKHVNPTRVPIEQKESYRWLENLTQSTRRLGDPCRCVHIGDRESDIFELFCAAHDAQTQFVFRSSVERLAGRGRTTITKIMARQPVQGVHSVEVRDEKGRVSTAQVQVRFAAMTVHPTPNKRKRCPPLTLTVIQAYERATPTGREPIRWQLLTNCPVTDLASAIEKLNWYSLRWKIETFHKVLKSGCQAEQSKLRTAERLTNLLAVLCVVGWRVFWLTMLHRANPEAPAKAALTPTEIEVLDHWAGPTTPPSKRTLSFYVTALARLGGYLARTHDPPPGTLVLWRGLSRLTDICLGFGLKKEVVGK